MTMRGQSLLVMLGMGVGICFHGRALDAIGVQAATPDEVREPALEFLLDHDGTTTPLRLDEPLQLKTSLGLIDMTLRMKPTRTFRLSGVSFDYPTSYGWEVDKADKECTTWTLDGNNVVLILTRYRDEQNQMVLCNAVVDEMKGRYGSHNCKSTTATLKLGKNTLEGYRVDARLAGQSLVQNVYSFVANGAVHLLILQDKPAPSGAGSDEYAALLKSLARTFEIRQESKR